MLGKRQLARWLQVLLFAHHSAGDFPSPLLNMAATRGKLMELLAEEGSSDAAFIDRAFMTGILSLLDTLLGMPMQEILEQIPLGEEVRDGLLHRRGRLGRLLGMVEGLERSDMGAVRDHFSDTQAFDTARLPMLQIDAMAWANSIGNDDG